jgi:hypothetical protein
MRLDPRSPYQVDFLALLIVAHYFERDYGKAMDVARHSLLRYPEDPRAYRFLAASLGQLGRANEARDTLRQAMTISPACFEAFVHSRPPLIRCEHAPPPTTRPFRVSRRDLIGYAALGVLAGHAWTSQAAAVPQRSFHSWSSTRCTMPW